MRYQAHKGCKKASAVLTIETKGIHTGMCSKVGSV